MPALLLPALCFELLLFIVPLIGIAILSFTSAKGISGTQYVDFFTSSYTLSALWRTIRLSFLATVVTLIVGYPVALYLVSPGMRGKTFVTFAIIAPLFVSPVVRSYGWLILLRHGGPLPLLFTEYAIVIGLAHVNLPFTVLAISASLQQIDPALTRAARNLGAGPFKAFARVTLPLSSPGIAAGALLTFSLSASAFVTPALVGGSRIPMMSYVVYNDGLVLLDWPRAAAVAIVLLAVTLTVATIYGTVGENVPSQAPAG